MKSVEDHAAPGSAKTLKEQHRARRPQYPIELDLRIHRAISWLHRAEKEEGDLDARFIFLWIAFNAAYGLELRERSEETQSERALLREFLARLLTIDQEQRLYHLLWDTYGSRIRTLIDNPFVFRPFWDAQAGSISATAWKSRFDRERHQALKALTDQDTLALLQIVLDRLYVLRNQLLHGGATWNSSVNRAQVRDSAHLLGDLLPVMIQLLLDHPEIDLPMPSYPVVSDAP